MLITCKTIERVLSQSEPAPEDLRPLQALLDAEDAYSYWAVTLRGERAVHNGRLEALESGKVKDTLFGVGADWQDQAFPFAFQERVRDCHPLLFAFTARVQAAHEMSPRFRANAIQQIDSDMRKTGRNAVSVFILAYFKLANAFSRCHAVLRCHAAGLAAERYRRLHGDWPASLDQLAPDLISAVPTDPFTDDPLLYRRLADGVVIYSVGLDGEDNGGNVDVVNVSDPGTDIGIRLWDVAKRRQPPKADEPAKQP
jgi:hypothetical protein